MKGSTFNQLLVFNTIAREGSITKAAQKLEVAAPSVSNALKALEQQIGLPLFTRTTRRVELTEAGKLLHNQTNHSVNELTFALEGIKEVGQAASGKVRITAPKFVYQHFLKPHYAEFCQQYPDIELEISLTDATIDILKEGFDLGIRFGDRVDEGMVAKALTKPMKEAFFVSKQYAESYGIPKDIAELQQHKLVQYRFISSNQLVPVLLDHKGETVNVEMPNALIVNDTDLMVDATLKGLGIGRMVEPAIKDLLKSGDLIPVLPEHWYPYSALYVYFHRNTQKAKRVRVLIDFLIKKFAQ